MHSTVVIVLYAAFALCCCAIPPIYMSELASRQIFVGVAVALTSIVGTSVYYATVSLPLYKLQKSVDKCLEHYHETERRIELATTQKNLLLLTSHCADKTPMLLGEFNVNSFLDELRGAQASAKDMCETLFGTVALNAKLRAEALRAASAAEDVSPLRTPSGQASRMPPDPLADSVQRRLDPMLMNVNRSASKGAVEAQSDRDRSLAKAQGREPRAYGAERELSISPAETCTVGEDRSSPPTPQLGSLTGLQSNRSSQQNLRLPAALSKETQLSAEAPMRRTSVFSIPQLVAANADFQLERSSLGSTPASLVTPASQVSGPPAQQEKLLELSRGSRFSGDKENIFLFVERSLNKNIVVYESILEQPEGGAGPLSNHNVGLSLSEPVKAYWLDIDPAYVEKRRKKGVMTDVEELNFIEKKMAYGLSAELETVDASPLSVTGGRRSSRHILVPSQTSAVRGKHSFTLKFAALPTRDMRLVLLQVRLVKAGGASPHIAVVPVVECIIDGKRCVLERVFVGTSTSAFRTSPDFVDLFGRSVEESCFGEQTSERVTY
jgi:hypothetical protein